MEQTQEQTKEQMIALAEQKVAEADEALRDAFNHDDDALILAAGNQVREAKAYLVQTQNL